MPTQHGKKHKEKKVKVKKEPTELKPLSEYVEDRLELIKQAFACLKPKTIQGITPKFLQKESLESIQEKCLDEVLGISKKRLMSIINDTKCPTDTESSDDDDVQDIAEHISLDEISSDDDAKTKPKNNKKVDSKSKSSKATKIKEEKPAATEEKKEYSVLELLELQARARAIRSQLAQEPVTKIELDDDDDEPQPEASVKAAVPEKESTPKKKDKKGEKKKKDVPPKSSNSSNNVANGNAGISQSPEKKKKRSPIRAPELAENLPSRRITIKRNFRKQSPVADGSAKRESEDKVARDSSPEVMPILDSPETFCISSEDEDEQPAIEKNKEEPPKEVKTEQESIKDLPAKSPDPPEEGEIGDEEEKNEEQQQPPQNGTEAADSAETTNKISNGGGEELVEGQLRLSQSEAENSNNESTPANDEPKLREGAVEQSKDDPDVLCVQLDDDCIDLECDEPIEEEDEETMQSATAAEMDEALREAEENAAIQILDSSADEEVDEQDSASNDTKSWGERWLESSKVSKILAASKLGNQMRRQIKLKRKGKDDPIGDGDSKPAQDDEREAPPTKELEDVAGGAEEGSIEQYKKIVNNSNAKVE